MEENKSVVPTEVDPLEETKQHFERVAYNAHVAVAQALAVCPKQIAFTICASVLASLHVQFGVDDAKLTEVRQFMEKAYAEKLEEIRKVPEYEQALISGFTPIGIPAASFQPNMTFVFPVPAPPPEQNDNPQSVN